jgi:hypothetical protein
MCARNISTVKALAGSMHGIAVVRGSKGDIARLLDEVSRHGSIL